MPRSIIQFLSFNRLDLTRKALDRYFQNTTSSHKLVICDNGSVDGSIEYLKELQKSKPDVDFIFYKQNSGAHRPRSHFMHMYHKQYEFLGFVANDVYVSQSWLADFEKAMDTVPKIGIMGGIDREWGDNQKISEGGFTFYSGSHFGFSDGYYLMRSKIVQELQDCSKAIFAHHEVFEYPHPGYFYFNSPLVSQAYLWNDIKNLGYHTACHPAHRMQFVQDAEDIKSDWHKQYTVFTKIIMAKNKKKYADETGGLIEFEMNGQPGQWLDEPAISRRAPDQFLEGMHEGLLAQLDKGVEQSDINAKSPEDWDKTSYNDIFKR